MKKKTIALIISSMFISGAFANEPLFKYQDTRDLLKPKDVSSEFSQQNIFQLGSGSITLRVKNVDRRGLTSFLGVSNPNSNTQYLNLYMNRIDADPKKNITEKDVVGLELRNNSNLISNSDLTVDLPRNNSEFRTITYTFDKANQQINIYVDGQKRKTHTASKFFEDIENLSSAYLGKTERASQSGWRATANLYYADVTTNVPSEQEVLTKHQQLQQAHQQALANDEAKRTALGALMGEKMPIFVKGQAGANNYRIPSLITQGCQVPK